jgi:hypothetical protein
MNLPRWLAMVLVLLALGGCAQMATGQGQSPYDRYGEHPRDRGGDGGGGERRQQHVAEAIRAHLTAAPKPAAYPETLRLPGSQ